MARWSLFKVENEQDLPLTFKDFRKKRTDQLKLGKQMKQSARASFTSTHTPQSSSVAPQMVAGTVLDRLAVPNTSLPTASAGLNNVSSADSRLVSRVEAKAEEPCTIDVQQIQDRQQQRQIRQHAEHFAHPVDDVSAPPIDPTERNQSLWPIDKTKPLSKKQSNSSATTTKLSSMTSSDTLQPPAKRIKTKSVFCAAMDNFKPYEMVATVLSSDSSAMLSVAAEGNTLEALDLLATLCNAESGSAPGFSKGNANGQTPEHTQLWSLNDVGQSSSTDESSQGKMPLDNLTAPIWHYGVAFVGGVMLMSHQSLNEVMSTFPFMQHYGQHYGEATMEPGRWWSTEHYSTEIIKQDSTLPESNNDQLLLWLSLSCYVGAVGCYYLPVWARNLFRKYSLDISHPQAVEVQEQILRAFVVAQPCIQAGAALYNYWAIGGFVEQFICEFLLPTLFVTVLTSLLSYETICRVRRIAMVIGFPLFCICQGLCISQGHKAFEIGWWMHSRWQIISMILHTSLIIHLQETLIVFAGVFAIHSPEFQESLIPALWMLVLGPIALCIKIVWFQRSLPSD